MTPIISEGYPFIFGCAALGVLLGFSVHPYVAVIPFVLMLYFCYFFRNPKRHIELDESAILSPADGTVTDIVELETDEFVKEPCTKVPRETQYQYCLRRRCQRFLSFSLNLSTFCENFD